MNPGLMALAVFWTALAVIQMAAAETAPELQRGFAERRFQLERGDVVAFVGGTDVAAALHSGHVESLLAAQYCGLGIRYRNFGWEGDTVFVQPRDVNFPPLAAHMEKAGATVIVLQFGRAEALEGLEVLPRFASAYESMIEAFSKRTRRLAIVTPPPFENSGELLPNLASRNGDLAAFVEAIRALANKKSLPLLDVFAELGGGSGVALRLTENGLQLSPRGHGLVARAFMDQAGYGRIARLAGDPSQDGAWSDPAMERLRLAVLEKNRLWLHYWRPHNWAFLGGDRVSQPSSRDHVNPKVRWFPIEMEKFVPLIHSAEARLEEAASNTALP